MSKHAAVSQLSAVAGPLSAVQRKFILHWGEMGTRWGVNRTVAQVHALLYISPQPLNADDIVEALEVARSNVSTSLKELQGVGHRQAGARASRQARSLRESQGRLGDVPHRDGRAEEA
jgi:hypothetical protein